MKRRKFIQSLALVPAAGATALAQTSPAPAPPAGPGRGGFGPAPASQPDPLTYGSPDDAGETVLKFFTPVQFAALQRLGRLLVPASGANPGAMECHAAEFLDFLMSQSPVERQGIYRAGLDGLNAAARKRADTTFGETDDQQADAIVMTFLGRPWTFDPADPVEKFLRIAQADLPRATRASREWALATGNASSINWLRPL